MSRDYWRVDIKYFLLDRSKLRTFTGYTGRTASVAGGYSSSYAIFSIAEQKKTKKTFYICIYFVCLSNLFYFNPTANLNLQNCTWRFPGCCSLLTLLLLTLLHKQMTKTVRRTTTKQPTPIMTHIHQLSPSSRPASVLPLDEPPEPPGQPWEQNTAESKDNKSHIQTHPV